MQNNQRFMLKFSALFIFHIIQQHFLLHFNSTIKFNPTIQFNWTLQLDAIILD